MLTRIQTLYRRSLSRLRWPKCPIPTIGLAVPYLKNSTWRQIILNPAIKRRDRVLVFYIFVIKWFFIFIFYIRSKNTKKKPQRLKSHHWFRPSPIIVKIDLAVFQCISILYVWNNNQNRLDSFLIPSLLICQYFNEMIYDQGSTCMLYNVLGILILSDGITLIPFLEVQINMKRKVDNPSIIFP